MTARFQDENSRPCHVLDNFFLRPSESSDETEKKVAMIMLNSISMTFDVVQRIWSKAKLHYCADGGANRLYDCTVGNGYEGYTPDVIRGDLDSLRCDAQKYYETQGTRLQKDNDQDTNDLDKCIADLMVHPLLTGGSCGAKDWIIVVIGPFGGRLDQEMAAYHTAIKWVDSFHRFLLLSRSNWAEPLCSGRKNVLQLKNGIEGPQCGLFALQSPVCNVRTEGLHWNINDKTVAMGDFVSSSNQIAFSTWDQSSQESLDEMGKKEANEMDSTAQVVIESSGGGNILWVCSLNMDS